MKEIIINDNQLTEEQIEKKVIRVKGLMVNSRGKILLAHNNNTYQFPGGHKEEQESMQDCIKREIKEETGIDIEVKEEPFLCIKTYDNDYFGTGKKVLNSIYYYRFMTDAVPNFNETHYDELELATDFNLFFLNIKDLKSFILKNIEEGNIDSKIGREMLHVMDVYDEIYEK